MRKAFDQNVSRAKPKLRLGGLLAEVAEPQPTSTDALSEEVRDRVDKRKAARPSAVEAVQRAIAEPNPPAEARVGSGLLARDEDSKAHAPVKEVTPAFASESAPVVVVQTTSVAAVVPQAESDGPVHAERRERLKERLKAVRENPRLEPLPPTVGETGHLAVERIAGLYQELSRLKSQNLSLTQELEAARRAAEKATEEARARTEEARRLAEEGQKRAELLSDLERELSVLESERDEVLVSVQEDREALKAVQKEKEALEVAVAEKDQALAESLVEEEKLATELEAAQDQTQLLRRSVEALTTERDVLSRQVTQLTAERTELLDARRALEAVHRALATAR